MIWSKLGQSENSVPPLFTTLSSDVTIRVGWGELCGLKLFIDVYLFVVLLLVFNGLVSFMNQN